MYQLNISAYHAIMTLCMIQNTKLGPSGDKALRINISYIHHIYTDL